MFKSIRNLQPRPSQLTGGLFVPATRRIVQSPLRSLRLNLMSECPLNQDILSHLHNVEKIYCKSYGVPTHEYDTHIILFNFFKDFKNKELVDSQFLLSYYPVDLLLRRYIIFLKTIDIYSNTWKKARRIPQIIESSIRELLRLLYQFLDFVLYLPTYANHDISNTFV